MIFKTITPENLLGALNDVEQKHAPKKLFVRGDVSLPSRFMCVSIVGSRKATPEGMARARTLSRAIVARGGVVVSGLADGIDTAAHTACIEAGGKTIAVLGTPLDQATPVKNKALQEKIATEHLLISQFPLGSPAQPKNFAIRNRTMALISSATVIIEAGEKSGTIHQGWEAIRLGRPLFILESTANNPNLTWPQKFIQYGAEVLNKDLLDDFFNMLPEGGRGDEIFLGA
jgi:DNA processing protein